MKKSFTIIILSILILFSCNKKEKNIASNINIDSKIKENTIFRKLNDSLEFNFNKRDSIGAKRSSNINFEITINDTITRVTELKAKSSFLNTYYFGKENEQIQTKKSDTLVVYIDNSDGYSSEGIKILVNKDNYDIKYFMTSPLNRFGIDYRMALLGRSSRIVSCRLLWFLCSVILFVVLQILLRLL